MGPKLSADVEIRRDLLLERLEKAQPRVVALIAPAGFGKSTLAQQLIAGHAAAVCDLTDVVDGLDVARRLLPALALESPDRTQTLTQRELMLGDDGTNAAERVNLALEAWKVAVCSTVFVFENAESLVSSPAARAFVFRLLSMRPEGRAIVICSRENLPVHLTRFAPPHQILTLRAHDLAFTHSELRGLFRAYSEDARLIVRVAQISQGWPIAVFLLKRFAAEGRLEDLVERLGDVAFEELHDYLADQVLAALAPTLVEALFACACIPNAAMTDLQSALDDAAIVQQLSEFSRESPFLTRSADGAFVLHPLLASLLLGRREQECDELRERTARRHVAAERFLRAAEIQLLRGQQELAAAALASHEVIRENAPSMRYARILACIDRRLVQRHPRLWAVTALLRMFCVDTEELLDEAEALWRALPPNVTPLERYYILIFRINFMSYMGLWKNAESLLNEFAAEHAVGAEPKTFFDAYVFYLLGVLRGRLGKVDEAERYLTLALPLVGGMDLMASGTLLALGADVARARGEWAVERQFIERATESARRSGLHNFVAFDLAESAFGAWLFGDDANFSRYAAELDEVVHKNGVCGFGYFACIARGRAAEAGDADLLKFVAYGHIVAAAGAHDATAAVRHAKAAVRSAQEYGSPFVEVLAHVALGALDGKQFDESMRRATEAAARVQSPRLHAAVQAVSQRRPDAFILTAFLRRLQRDAGRGEPALEISLTDGSVLVASREVALPDREMALLVALSLRREPVSRSRLTDMLWPELDEAAARNAFSVCLHRLRQHVGDDRMIVRLKDGYALGSEVHVDLWEIDRTITALRTRTALSDADRNALGEVYHALRRGEKNRMLAWEWFAPTRRHIAELCLETAQRLGSDALARGEIGRALQYAEEMIRYDPCDEGARHIAITAHLARGDRAAAMRQYRQYRETLLAELQCEPSTDTKRLVGLVPASSLRAGA